MKKYLPVIIFVAAVFFVSGVFMFMRGGEDEVVLVEDEQVADLPQDQRPFTSLTPSDDAHFMTLTIEDISVDDATSFDFEFLYLTGEGIQQGTGSNVKFSSGGRFEKEILLGTESSGVKRFDEGVERGTLTLRFRNDDGKLVGKLSTDFHLQTNVDELTSVDGSFVYVLDDAPTDVYFLTMETFGADTDVNIEGTNYAIFSSDGETYEGEVKS